MKMKLSNFGKAIDRLQEGVRKYDGSDELARDGLIRRFEFTFELAWKALKAVFENEGLAGLNSPKLVLREAYAADMIKDEELWLQMLKDRNSTSHLYDEKIAVQISKRIQTSYLTELIRLAQAIRVRIGDEW